MGADKELVLYVVATPIGNLGDISARAAEVLSSADFIAAEDTRVTSKLLNHLGIKKPIVSYYQHNMQERGEVIIDRILGGESCALCSDAGTPAISDPGELLVKQAYEAGICVVPIPGPCAAITALSASGLITGRFVFEGFIPVSKKSRAEHLDDIKAERKTMIFYEAPHKLKRTLDDLLAVLGDRKLTVARELTKLHEEIFVTTIGEAVAKYADEQPRGEFVLVVEGAALPQKKEPDENNARDLLEEYLAEGTALLEASKLVASKTGMRKSDVYKIGIEMKEKP
ncbi:MAG: 16S rRNA (cytidine(1402)-2'-O)-methyltransferase [Oscillospiraceae bacterium]